MHEVEVEVLSAEERDEQIAQFSVDGERFAFSRFLDASVVIELTGGSRETPVVVNAHSLSLALERAKELLAG